MAPSSALGRRYFRSAKPISLAENCMRRTIRSACFPGAVVDAAVVFLLAMKRHGVSDPRRIPACTVRWALHGERESVNIAS